MKLWLKFVIFFQLFCILFIELNKCYNNKIFKKDICDVNKFEDNIHSMFGSYADKYEKWPSNEKEMDIWCKTVPKSHRKVKSYADKCLTGLSKLTIAVIAYNAGKANKIFCTNKQERKRFIEKSGCANKAKDESIKCWKEMVSIVETVKKVKIQKDKLPSLCCTFYFYNKCAINVIKKLYPNYCTAENIEHAELHIKKVSMDSFRILCSEYENHDKCANYMDKIAKYGKIDAINKHKTPYPIMFEILETL